MSRAASYIHLHLWLEGYRQIPTNGPLFLLDAVTGLALLGWTVLVTAARDRPGPGGTPDDQSRIVKRAAAG